VAFTTIIPEGKSGKPVVDPNMEKGRTSAGGSQDGQSIQQTSIEKENHTSESDSTANNDALGKQESEAIPIPKDAKEETDEDAVFAHLPEHEKAILKEQLHIPDVQINFIGLYRYASTNDLLILAVSAICAIGAGAIMPLFTVCCSYFLLPLKDYVLTKS
jgi:ATP-binding cassette subfamily B (MDR/TAP) protein 1